MPRFSLAAALGAAVLAACAPAALATDRYMAVDGTDNGWCADPAQPCATLDYVYNNSQAGDTIRLAAGAYSVASMGSRDIIQRRLLGAQAGVSVRNRASMPETQLPLVDGESGYTVFEGEIDGVSLPPTTTGGIPDDAVRFLGTGALRNSIVFTGANAIDATLAGPGSEIEIEGNLVAGFSSAAQLGDGTYTVSQNVLFGGDAIRAEGAATIEAIGNELQGNLAAIRLGTDTAGAEIHGNRIFGGTMSDGSIVYAQQTPIVDAEDNWWGCNGGPNAGSGCAPATVGFVDTTPWLTLTTAADPDPVLPGGTADLIASVRRNSAGVETDYDILWGFQAVSFGAADGTLAAPSAFFGTKARAKVGWTAPSTAGPVSWSATFDSVTVSSSVGVQQGSNPVATVSPRGLNFGTQAVGTTSAAQTVTVTNDGDGPLQITGFSGKGTGSSLFAVTNDTCVGADVDPGESCVFEVRFTPSKDATWTPKIEVVSNAPKVAVGLRGTGVPRTTVTPASGDFGSVQRRTTSAPIAFTVANNGDDPLPVTSLRLNGTGKSLYSIDPGTCTGSIAARGTCTLSVTFAPLAAGTWSPELLVETNRVTKVPLTGTGVR